MGFLHVRRVGWGVLCVAALVLAGCGGSSSGGGGANPGIGSGTVTAAAGGTVTTTDGLGKVEVPAGAVAADTVVTVERVPGANLPANLATLAGPNDVTYRLSPDGLAFPAGTVATVTIVLENAVVVQGNTVTIPQIMVLHQGTGTLEPLANAVATVDPATGKITVTGEVSHFSELKLSLGGTAEAEVTGVPERAVIGVPWIAHLQVRVAAKIVNDDTDLFVGYKDHPSLLPVLFTGSDAGAWGAYSDAQQPKWNRAFDQDHHYLCNGTGTGRYRADIKFWPEGTGDPDANGDPPKGDWLIDKDGAGGNPAVPTPAAFIIDGVLEQDVVCVLPRFALLAPEGAGVDVGGSVGLKFTADPPPGHDTTLRLAADTDLLRDIDWAAVDGGTVTPDLDNETFYNVLYPAFAAEQPFSVKVLESGSAVNGNTIGLTLSVPDPADGTVDPAADSVTVTVGPDACLALGGCVALCDALDADCLIACTETTGVCGEVCATPFSEACFLCVGLACSEVCPAEGGGDACPFGGPGGDFCAETEACGDACIVDPDVPASRACLDACVPSGSTCADECLNPYDPACETCLGGACPNLAGGPWGDGCPETAAALDTCAANDDACIHSGTDPLPRNVCDASCAGAADAGYCFTACLWVDICPGIRVRRDLYVEHPDTGDCMQVSDTDDIPPGYVVRPSGTCPEASPLPADATFTIALGSERLVRVRIPVSAGKPGRAKGGIERAIFELDPGEYGLIAHASGATLYDLATGNSFGSPLFGLGVGIFGALALHGPDGDFVVGYGPGGQSIRYYDYNSHGFGGTLVDASGSYITDGFLPETQPEPFDNRYALVTNNFNTVGWFQAGEAGTFYYERYRHVDPSWYDATPAGGAFTAQGGFDTGALVVTSGSPGSVNGELWFGEPSQDSPFVAHTGSKVGDVGDDPRYLRCLGAICAAANYGSNNITVIHWPDRNAAPTIMGNVPVGAGPVGVDLKDLGGGAVEVLTTGYGSDDYTLTPVAADGTPGTPFTRALTDCIAPGFGAYVGVGDTHIAVTCNVSATLRVFQHP